MTTHEQTPGMSRYQCIELEQREDGTGVVSFRDDRIMDPERIEVLGKELLSLGSEHEHPQLVLDFSQVRFLSSAAINKLIVMEKRLRARGGRLRLCSMKPAVRDLFGFTHLDSLFAIDDDIKESIKAINN
jgi:anti-sigma B factor antagonist